jgi:hypothetical protein
VNLLFEKLRDGYNSSNKGVRCFSNQDNNNNKKVVLFNNSRIIGINLRSCHYWLSVSILLRLYIVIDYIRKDE